jgi:voltage-gated potassium channel Kch/Trk K+ transport system NAD-binding subunit
LIEGARRTIAAVPSAATSDPISARPSRRARLRYRFDTALSRGPAVVIAWLGIIMLIIVLVAASVVTIFKLAGISGGPALDLPQAFWQSLLRVLDTGTFSSDSSWPARIIGLLVTLAGIFLAGSLIGLIASGVDQRIEELGKGRSAVLESDHTLILGWSPRVPPIVRELVIANESRKHAAIVILAEHDKGEMEQTLRELVRDTRTTTVVCRSGAPWLPNNLEITNIAEARSVIVIGDGDDTSTVKSLLAIRASVDLSRGRLHVVAEVNDHDTASSVRSLIGPALITVSSDDVVAELTAQACRQRGLSTVFHELLDFDGDEVYFGAFPHLVGRTYAECLLAFERCAVLGVLDASRVVLLNPPPDRVLASGEELIAVAEDDSVFVTAPMPIGATVRSTASHGRQAAARRIVVVGWSVLGPRVLAELDEFFSDQTTVELLVDPTLVDVPTIRSSVVTSNVRLEISELTAGPEVVALQAARSSFHEVIVLGYRGVLSDDEADARTLLTLLAFRQIRQADDVGEVRMVAELLDQRNAPLAEATGADDFIVSDELTSLMLAQLSEHQELIQVFDDLFDRSGSSIVLRDAHEYGGHLATCFADVVATAATLGHSAIGYRRRSDGSVVVNPAKSAKLQLQPDDAVLVVAPGLG